MRTLAEWLKMIQPAGCQHMRVLREAGLANAIRRGAWMHCELDRDEVQAAGMVMAVTARNRT